MLRSMSNRGVRVLLILTVVAVLAALVQTQRIDSAETRERDAAADVDRTLRQISVSLADFRAAQAGYVATGQGPAFWMKRGLELSSGIEAAIEHLRSSTTSTDARAHYDAAGAFLGNVSTADRRARDYVSSDQRFLASDAIFMDGLEATKRLEAEVNAAAAAERTQTDARMGRIGRERFITIFATLVWGMFVTVVVFARIGASPAAALPAEAASAASAQLVAPPLTPADIPALEATPSVRLPDVADLCADLARVLDGAEVNALMGRAVQVLGAKGAVLWVIDTTGAFLRPLVLHGYPDKVAKRLGALQVDADNITSLAFRSLQAQSANGKAPDAFGAIAVPLVTGTGCVGVFAAELKRVRSDTDTLSAARMIAAQLAALTSPVASPGRTAEA